MAKKTLLNTFFPDKARAKRELERAHHTAERVVEAAVEKSEHIIEHTRFLDEKLKKELELELKKTVTELSGVLKAETQKSISMILSGFTQELQIELKKSQKDLSDKVVAAFEQVQKELEEYKQTKQAGIDIQIEQKVTQLAKEVLQKTLSPKDHQNLVFEALERADLDGFFGRTSGVKEVPTDSAELTAEAPEVEEKKQ